MGRRGLTDDEVWPDLRERAWSLNDTNGHTVVPVGMALAHDLREAAETLGVSPPRDRDPLSELMFRDGVLHDFCDYVTHVYSVRVQAEKIIKMRAKLLSEVNAAVTSALNDAFDQYTCDVINRVVHAIGNWVRHHGRHGTISIVEGSTLISDGRVVSGVKVYLGVADMMNGQGWYQEERDYVGPSRQVELLPVVEANLMSLSALVNRVTEQIYAEYRSTGHR